MADIGEVVKSTLTDGNAVFNVTYSFDPTSGLNLVVRGDQAPLETKLGGRYRCGEVLQGTREGKPVQTTFSGTIKTDDGAEVFLGCGTDVLYAKVGSPPEMPYCHDRPLVPIVTNRVPSAD